MLASTESFGLVSRLLVFALVCLCCFFYFSDEFWNLYSTLSKFLNVSLEKHTKLWVFNGKMHICLLAYAFYVKHEDASNLLTTV